MGNKDNNRVIWVCKYGQNGHFGWIIPLSYCFLCVLFLFSCFLGVCITTEWFCPTSVIFFFSAYLVCLSFSQRTVATIWCLWVIYLQSIWMWAWMVCEWLVVECKYVFIFVWIVCEYSDSVCLGDKEVLM